MQFEVGILTIACLIARFFRNLTIAFKMPAKTLIKTLIYLIFIAMLGIGLWQVLLPRSADIPEYVPTVTERPEIRNLEATPYPIEIDNPSDHPLRVVINEEDKGTVAPGQVLRVEVPFEIPNIATAAFFCAEQQFDSIEFSPGRNVVLNPLGRSSYVVVAQTYTPNEAVFYAEENEPKVAETIKGERMVQTDIGLCDRFPETILTSEPYSEIAPSNTLRKLYRRIPEKPSAAEALRILSDSQYYFFEQDPSGLKNQQEKLIRIIKKETAHPAYLARIIEMIEKEAVNPLLFKCLAEQKQNLSVETLGSWLLGISNDQPEAAGFAATALVEQNELFLTLKLLEECPTERWPPVLNTLNQMKQLSPEFRGKLFLQAIQINNAADLATPLLNLFKVRIKITPELAMAMDDYLALLKDNETPANSQTLRVDDWEQRIQTLMTENLPKLPPDFAKATALRYLDASTPEHIDSACVKFLLDNGADSEILQRYNQLSTAARNMAVFKHWEIYQQRQKLSIPAKALFKVALTDRDSNIRYATFLNFNAIHRKTFAPFALHLMESAASSEPDQAIAERMAQIVKARGGHIQATDATLATLESKSKLYSLIGQSETMVIKTLGSPKQFLRLGKKTIMLYPAAQVDLENSSVVDISLTE